MTQTEKLGPFDVEIRQHSAYVKVPSRTDANVTYCVLVTTHFASCACKGYVFHGRCWHVDAVMDLLDPYKEVAIQ